MNAIPITPAMLEIARRVIWFEPPEKALADPVQFMAYAMTYAVHEDMRVIRQFVSDDDLRDALDHAPPGIIDPRSWAYWNSKMGRYPTPPMPVRRFGSADADPSASAAPDDLRRHGRAEWEQMRQPRSEADPDEVRRRARQEWLAKYGSKRGD